MSIYQHFRPEEKEFIDQILQWKDVVERTYVEKITDFLDPRQQYIVQSIIGSNGDVKCSFFGGSKATERKRAIIYPQYLPIDNTSFEISLFEVVYPHKFVTLTHRDVLGSLMSLQITRGKFGDILIKEDRVQFFTTNQLEDFIKMDVRSVGKANVELNKLPLEQAIDYEEQWQEQIVIVSSLRIDSVISAIFKISRQKAQLFIQRGTVKVNWKVVDQPSFACGESDIISVRGFGRAKVNSLVGKTRKDRYQVNIGLQK